jgi:type IV pilus assembly protein PilV
VDELMLQTRLDPRRSRGLTLVELLIALTVLAIGLLGLLAMQTQALQGSSHGRHVTEAARFAEEQMAFLQRQPWAAIPVSAWSAPRIVNGAVNSTGPSTPQSYSVIWRVQAGASASLRQLDVQVTWTTPEAPAGSPPKLYAISSTRHDG